MLSRFVNTVSSMMSFQRKEPIHVTITLGAKRESLEVFEDTTVQELITLIHLEIMKEMPADADAGEKHEELKLIYKGKQLSSLSDTMLELKVKTGDKMMALKRKNAVSGSSSNSSSSKSETESVLNPAFRDLKQLVNEVEVMIKNVSKLSKIINTQVSKSNPVVTDMKSSLKTLAGINEEHMKLLFRLDALETNGIDEIRTERKAMVVKVQQSQSNVDELSNKLKSRLAKVENS